MRRMVSHDRAISRVPRGWTLLLTRAPRLDCQNLMHSQRGFGDARPDGGDNRLGEGEFAERRAKSLSVVRVGDAANHPENSVVLPPLRDPLR
jgi:hypothetical protein